jgi:16S rRNA (guanine(966)-N(2))-methyltransferase RsmD
LRIVGGKYRGRVLNDFANIGVRPTGDKVRESFFNIVQMRIFGAKFLDLFSGTGAMGIEALSRGASKVVFNDSSRDSIKLIRKNLDKLKVDDDYEVYNSDGVGLANRLNEQFDIIYVDPPYATDLGLKSLSVIKRAMADGCVVIFEDEKPADFEIEGLKITDRRKYGRVHLTFFEKEIK